MAKTPTAVILSGTEWSRRIHSLLVCGFFDCAAWGCSAQNDMVSGGAANAGGGCPHPHAPTFLNVGAVIDRPQVKETMKGT